MMNKIIYGIIDFDLINTVYESRVVQYPSQDSHFEGGAKNPSKGISMKSLVLAADAQSGVGAGSKEEGRSTMACRR